MKNEEYNENKILNPCGDVYLRYKNLIS